MRIIIDAGFAFGNKEKGGINYLIPDFLQALIKIDQKNKYILWGYFFRNYFRRKKEIKIRNKNVKIKVLPIPGVLMRKFNKIGFPLCEILLKNEKAKIYHSISGFPLPNMRKIWKIITVYDISFEIFPDMYKERWYEGIKKSILIADLIITPSYFTKNDLIKYYKVNQEKVKVIYLGYDKEVFKPLNKEENLFSFRKKLDLPKKYIFLVITSIKRKNLLRILNVFERIYRNFKIGLVIVCGSKRVEEEVKNLLKGFNSRENIKIFSEVETTQLSLFYNCAFLFLFPSLYEGFGLPVLEAMACGVPVITSNISSLPEVVGDAGILVNPYDEVEIEEAIERLLTDEKLREELKEKGLKRAKLFSWEKTAMETLKVYESLT